MSRMLDGLNMPPVNSVRDALDDERFALLPVKIQRDPDRRRTICGGRTGDGHRFGERPGQLHIDGYVSPDEDVRAHERGRRQRIVQERLPAALDEARIARDLVSDGIVMKTLRLPSKWNTYQDNGDTW